MFRIIDENEQFLVVEKPINWGFHCEEEIGFFAQLEKERDEKLYPVHRLDKVTSGLTIVARTIQAARDLGELFESRQVEKYYLALSDKRPKKKQGAVVGDMARSRRGQWMLERTRNNPARTQFFSFGAADGSRLFVVRPRTGRTHQIRVALKSLGSPIIGDPLYHAPEHAVETVDRCYLHAYALRFELNETPYCYLAVPSEGELWQNFDNWPLAENLTEPWEMEWPRK